MSGRRLASFRAGDLAEDLGVFLLKAIAAVADVPRQEDVGVDAVCNLLRRGNDNCFYAEDNFAVQLKSRSVKRVEYEGHSLNWLTSQSVPLFIGSVSLDEASIELWPTISMFQAAMVANPTKILGYLNARQEYDPFPFQGKPPSPTEVWLRAPLVTWSVSDTQNEATRQNIYECLKKWFVFQKLEFVRLSVQQWSKIMWTTNQPQSITYGLVGVQPKDSLQTTFDKAEPYLRSIMMRALTLPQKDVRQSVMSPVMDLVVNLAKAGVDMTAARNYENLFEIALAKDEIFGTVESNTDAAHD